LEEMTGPSVALVEELCIDAVQLPHPERQVAVGRLDEQVVMVVHQAIGVADPVVAPCDVLEGVQEGDAVLVAPVDGLFLIAARGDVVDGAGVFDPKGSCHATRTSEKNGRVKHSRPDPRSSLKKKEVKLHDLSLWIFACKERESQYICLTPALARQVRDALLLSEGIGEIIGKDLDLVV